MPIENPSSQVSFDYDESDNLNFMMSESDFEKFIGKHCWAFCA